MSKHAPPSPTRTHSQQGIPGRIVGSGAPTKPAEPLCTCAGDSASVYGPHYPGCPEHAEWRPVQPKPVIHASPVPQPTPFAVGERVEYGPGNTGTIRAISGKYAWVYVVDAEKEHVTVPIECLRHPPAKRVVKQVEYVRAGGSKFWLHVDDSTVVTGVTPTGRTHSYEVNE